MLNRARAVAAAALAVLARRVRRQGGGQDCSRGRRRWCRSRGSKRATSRSRCARPSTCGPLDRRPTSGRRRSATSTRCSSTAATACKRGQLLALVRPSDLPDQLAAARGTLAQAQSSRGAGAHQLRARQAARARGGVVSQQELQQAQSAARDRRGRAAGGARRRSRRWRCASARRASSSPLDGVVIAAPARSRARWWARRAAARSSPWRASTCCACSSPSTSASSPASRVGKDAHVELDALPGKTFTRQGGARSRPRSIRPRARSTPRCSSTTAAASCARACTAAARSSSRCTRSVPVVPVGAVQCSATGRRYVFVARPGDKVVRGARSTLGVDGGDWFEVKAGPARRRRGRRRRARGAVGRREGPRRARPRSVRRKRRQPPAASTPRARQRTEDRRHVADPSRAAQPGPHLDDVADDPSCSAACRCAGSASICSPTSTSRSSASRPSIRARARPTSRSRSPQPIERAVSASPGVDRVESRRKQGVSLGQRLVQLRRQPGQRAVRGVAARRADPEHAAAGHPAAVHHQVRHHQHPGRAGRGQRRRAGRAAALRSRLQHHRAADRAHARRGQRQRRRRQDPRDRGQGRTATRCGRAASASSTSSTRSARRTCCCRAATCAPATATTTSSPTRRSRRRARSSDVIVRSGAARHGRGQSAAAVRVARRRRGRGRRRRISRRSCASTASAASTCACSSSRARTPSRSSTRSARRCRSCAACRPTCSWRSRSTSRTTSARRSARSSTRRCRAACWPSLVILIFLVSLRATGIVAVAIPLSIMATFVLLYFTGQTLNVFTLGGLALGVGRLVDDSIVELENIHRHLGMGQSRREAVLAAAQEVAMPILVSTITTIVVFLPGAVPDRRRAQPVHAARADHRVRAGDELLRVAHGDAAACLYWLKGHLGEAERGLPGAISRALDRVDHAYARSLGWVLRHRLVTVGAHPGACSASSLFLQALHRHRVLPRQRRVAVRASTSRRRSARASSGPSVVAERIEEAVNETLVNETASAIGDDDDRRRRPAAGADGRVLAEHRAALGQRAGQPGAAVASASAPTCRRPRRSAAALRDALPGTQVYFFIGGIVKRILNFGSPAPIDVEIVGLRHRRGRGATPSSSSRRLRAAATTRTASRWLTDLQIIARGELPGAGRRRRSPEGGRCWGSPSSRSRRPCSPAWWATRSSRRFRSPTRRPATSTSSTCGWTTRTARTSTTCPRSFMRTPAGGDGAARHHRQHQARQRAGASSTASTCSGSSTSPPTSRRARIWAAASAAVQRVLDELPPPDGFTVRLGGQTEAQQKAFGDLSFAARAGDRCSSTWCWRRSSSR